MRLTPRAPTLEVRRHCGCVALWHCGTVALWHCKDLWHCGTVALWYCGTGCHVTEDRGGKIVKKSVVWGSWGHFGRRKSSKSKSFGGLGGTLAGVGGSRGPKMSQFGKDVSGQFDFGTLFGPKRHQNGAQRHPKIVKKSHLISDVFFIAFGHQKSAKRIPLLAPKSNFFGEHQHLFIFDEHAPRLSETCEFEVQGSRK